MVGAPLIVAVFMSDKLITRLIRHRLDRFLPAEGGNVAVIFAFLLVPLLGFVGAAVDYSRFSAARSSMQSALDSALLMISKEAPALDAATLNDKATKYFNALLNTPVGGQKMTVTYTAASKGKPASLVASAEGNVTTSFLQVIGFPALTAKVGSTTSWSSTRMRVALALDNTYSMKGSKMTALKSAATDLVKTLRNSAAQDGDVYISVIPFAKDVNVGSSFYNESWIDWTDWNKDSENRSCNWWGNCSLNAKSTWNGCVTDRTEPHDTTNTLPTNTATKFPAEQYDACPQPILPLTYDWAQVNSRIDGMIPLGGTNQPIGLAWAWWTLSSGTPFSAPAKDPLYDYIDAIVLLTDGANTQQRNPAYGNGQEQTDGKIDARQKILCDNIKTAKVVVYAVQVNTDGGVMQTVLPYCASSTENFYNLTSANQIDGAFVSIGASLVKLRVSK
jgi:Flp pilus assembly protein TadG